MADGDIFVGSEIRMRTKLDVDLTNVTNVIYRWRKPKFGNPDIIETVEHICSVEDVLNGIIYYDTVGDIDNPEGSDLDIRGIYEQHVIVTFSDNKTVPSTVSYFKVKDLWEK